jgi:hypothetical protein
MLKKTNCSVPLADVNWDNFAPVKVKVFFWVFRHNNARHGVLAIDHCPFCLDASEDTDHLFFQCPRVAAFWTHVCHDAPPPLATSKSPWRACLSPLDSCATPMSSSLSGYLDYLEKPQQDGL